MTNGGIIEGHTEYSGCSDLSPATFFGGGETRMQMREALGGVKGPLGVLRHLAPICFMIKYLALLVVGASVSHGQQFNGTIFDVNTGRIQVISGETEPEYKPYQPQIDAYKKIIADTKARIAQMRVESEAREQTHQLRMQTEYLRKIAEKE